ncbi:MAG: thiamine-phosphate kinase [Alistipes sp.]|nr:thiamine-phosphate kinase [Alistipes sp.]
MTEFGFVESIKKMFGEIPQRGFEGIGDDCAVLPVGDGTALVFTTDLLVEGVHFLRSAASAAEIGSKALAVNLSDVAAMGAVPVATMLSLALTDDTAGAWAEEFMCGYRARSSRWSVPLVGGDTSKSLSGVMVNVVAIGRARIECLKRRSAARNGDAILVCGALGASAEGLKDILNGDFETENACIHKNPTPQIEEGIWLGGRREVHAMMDLSDGLASDLEHILKASHVGARIDTECIPCVSDLKTAVCGGEDYKLLFTMRHSAVNRLRSEFAEEFGYAPAVIGTITKSQSNRPEWFADGKPIEADWQGFTHF